METVWFFWLRYRRAYDSASDTDFWFSLGHKRLYDSDSVVSENQPLQERNFLGNVLIVDHHVKKKSDLIYIYIYFVYQLIRMHAYRQSAQ